MIEKNLEIFNELFDRYPSLKCIENDIKEAFELLVSCYSNGGKLLIAGNGGSAADSEHIAGELMKSFCHKREIDTELKKALVNVDFEIGGLLSEKLENPLTAIPLVAHEALTTAYANDKSSVCGFAQQLLGFGRQNDVFFAISTSGNSENVLYACVTARALGMKIIGLTGKSGGKLKEYSDVAICVPETETYKIQELHLPVYHTLCLMLENHFFK